MRMLAFLLLLALPCRAQRAPQVAAASGFDVEVHYEDERTLLSVQAREASARSVMAEIARELGLELDGFEEVDREPRVTAFLHRRPYRDAIRWTLGSVGLRARIDSRRIRVHEDVGPYPQAHEMLEEANRRYLQALRDHSDWPLADQAEMARATINEELGPDFWGAAELSYDTLLAAYPQSELVPEAMLRSARLLGRLGEWERAAVRYEELAGLDRSHPYHVTARLEMAEALCRSGEGASDEARQQDVGQKAVWVLDALDNNYPSQVGGERRARLLVRSRALSLSGDAVAALRALDAAARYSVAGQRDPLVLELRARALARAGQHGSAATAWLAYADELSGVERERAYEAAARAALEGGHEVAVLTIAKAAEAESFGARLAPVANEAKARLGLPDADLSAFDARAHLSRGEVLVEQRLWEQAVDALRLAHAKRTDLDAAELLRLALAEAKALDRAGLPNDAIDVLRELVVDLPDRRQREAVYRLASDLYERRNLLDRAIEALRGRL